VKTFPRTRGLIAAWLLLGLAIPDSVLALRPKALRESSSEQKLRAGLEEPPDSHLDRGDVDEGIPVVLDKEAWKKYGRMVRIGSRPGSLIGSKQFEAMVPRSIWTVASHRKVFRTTKEVSSEPETFQMKCGDAPSMKVGVSSDAEDVRIVVLDAAPDRYEDALNLLTALAASLAASAESERRKVFDSYEQKLAQEVNRQRAFKVTFKPSGGVAQILDSDGSSYWNAYDLNERFDEMRLLARGDWDGSEVLPVKLYHFEPWIRQGPKPHA